jgi:hypothetical protein
MLSNVNSVVSIFNNFVTPEQQSPTDGAIKQVVDSLKDPTQTPEPTLHSIMVNMNAFFAKKDCEQAARQLAKRTPLAQRLLRTLEKVANEAQVKTPMVRLFSEKLKSFTDMVNKIRENEFQDSIKNFDPNDKTPYLESLPGELLIRIFDFASHPVFGISKTVEESARIYEISIINDKALDLFEIRDFDSYKQISSYFGTQLSTLQYLSTLGLKKLTVKDDKEEKQAVSKFFAALKSLRSFHFSGEQLGCMQPGLGSILHDLFSSNKAIKELSLEKFNISPKTLRNLIESCSKLESLKISDWTPGDAKISELFAEEISLPELKELEFPIKSANELKKIAQFKKLEKLSLDLSGFKGTFKDLSETIGFLKECSLKELILKHTDTKSPTDFLGCTALIKKMNEHLSFEKMTFEGQKMLLYLYIFEEYLKQNSLKELTIANISDKDLMIDYKGCPNIETVRIFDCPISSSFFLCSTTLLGSNFKNLYIADSEVDKTCLDEFHRQYSMIKIYTSKITFMEKYEEE